MSSFPFQCANKLRVAGPDARATMAALSATWTWIFACLMLILFTAQLCGSANVEIEDADSSRHVFELKTAERESGSTYMLCANCKGFSSGPVPTPSALRFTVRFSPTGDVLAACETQSHSLPPGLCSPPAAGTEAGADTNGACLDGGVCAGGLSQDDLADEIVRKNLLPFPSGHSHSDHRVAHAVVELNSGNWEQAVAALTKILEDLPGSVGARYARGVAYARRGAASERHAIMAVADLSVAAEKEPERPEILERRAEVYITLNQFQEALGDLNAALALAPSPRLRFSLGVINLLLENFAEAEAAFRTTLEEDGGEKGVIYLLSYFHLGLAQYYRGRLRTAVEVFKEVLQLQPDHVQAAVSLAQTYTELGNLKAAMTRFDAALTLQPDHALGLQLKGSLLYRAGDPAAARAVLQTCTTLHPDNYNCQYLLALANVALGQFYAGVKLSTKVMVKSLPTLKLSAERVRAQYVREYARYLHSSLDTPLTQLQPEVDLDEKLRSTWVQGLPLPLQGQGMYREQPGLQPEISDVTLSDTDLQDWARPDARALLCLADKVGVITQVSADGFLPNRRLNRAMGLAALHVAQLADARWRNIKASKTPDAPFRWRDLFSVAVRYRQLVDPEQPVLWVSSLQDYGQPEGHREDVTLVRGAVSNVRGSQYVDLAFRLAKTMLEHYTGAGAVSYAGLAADIDRATTCQDLLRIARKRQINPHGFLVSTQVPTTISPPAGGGGGSSSSSSSSPPPGGSEDRLDGTVLVLTEDALGRTVFALSMASSPARTAAYAHQMDHLLLQLHTEVVRVGGRPSDLDPVLNAVLSLLYYFYNLTPLTRGSSAVAYAVALGLIMSLGRQVSGRLPAGKLLDMEAMLSGAPDAFVTVVRQWINVKKAATPLSTLPPVWETLPSVRSVLEVLTLNTTALCL